MKDISTEDQNPNLSDCHGCGVRVNHTNRLQPMNSMWRIVLLCKKCTKRVNSSELCPYCFTVVNKTDCFKCSDCQHCIHKDCVNQYGTDLGLICVDCWIPEAFGSNNNSSSSIRARKRKFKNKNTEEVERKVAAAAKASENALMKAVVAKNAVELAKGILSVVKCRKVGETEGVDDAKLAVLLHRAIDSSPRIATCAWFGRSVGRDDASVTCYSRRRAGKDIRSLDASLIRYSRRDDAPVKCYSRRRVGKDIRSLDASLIRYSRRDDAVVACYSRRRAGKDTSSLGVPLTCYSRRRVKGCFKNSGSLSALLSCYSRWLSSGKAFLHDGECECVNGNLMCYFRGRVKGCFKNSGSLNAPLSCYSRWRSSSKACLHDGECECVNGNSCQENDVGRIGLQPNRYILKYHRVGKGKPRPSLFVKDSANLYTEGITDTRNSGNGYECREVCEKVDGNTDRFLLKYKRISRFNLSNHPMEPTTLSDARPCSALQ